MDLHVLLSDFVKSKGRDILASPLLCNMMDDELMFRPFEHRDYKLLFRLMVKKGYVKNLAYMSQWNDSAVDALSYQIEAHYTGSADIRYAVQCVGYALGCIKDVNIPTDTSGTPIQQQINLDEEVVRYIPHGSSTCIGTMIPASMATHVHNHLNRIAMEEGSVAEFVMSELKVSTQSELESMLSGEQIDGVAMAISQMRDGKGFILGDMTGVGKGRQVAAILKWAVLCGKCPVFVTEKSTLFSDLYRDMNDIGCGYLRPFILNSDAEARIVDSCGNVAYNRPSTHDMEEFKKTKRVPDGYNYLILTYSQLFRTESKNWKAECVKSVIKDSYLILDESHNASGDESNVGKFFREAVTLASGVCYASATYAKYPSSMPVYALKTAMGDTKVPADVLIDTIKDGGPILQEVMARGLVESGSMIRRQRDMTGVIRQQYKNENPATVTQYRKRYDMVISILEEIHEFQHNYIMPYIHCKRYDVENIIRKKHHISRSETFESRKSKIYYGHFSALMMPVVKQLLFALKTEDVIDVTLQELKAERKPIIQVNRTMAGILSKIVKIGDSLLLSDLVKILPEYMKGMFHYIARGVTLRHSSGPMKQKVYTVKCEFTLKDLCHKSNDTTVEEQYNAIVDRINNFDSGLPLSPIDYFIQRMTDAGYTVGELTQRKQLLIYKNIGDGANSQCECLPRSKSSKKTVASEFNSGKIDVLIGNSVMASGISLHSSKNFNDQRSRTVITWERQDCADKQVQFDGRADRTGQLTHCKFITIQSPIPAESRFIMQSERKLHSLYANIEANQRASENDCDLMNEYGRKVISEFLNDNPEAGSLFDWTVGSWSNKDEDFGVLSFFRGLCLAPCDEQERMIADIMHRYKDMIETAEESGQNKLRCKMMPLNATLLNRSSFFKGNKGSVSVFAKDTMLDEIEMDILQKTMSADEVVALAASLKDSTYVKNEIIKYREHKKDEFALFYQKLSQAAFDKIKKLEQLTPTTQTKARIQELKSRASYNKSLNDRISLLDVMTQKLISTLNRFTPMQAVAIPPVLHSLEDPRLAGCISRGLFLGYRCSGKWATENSVKAVFAVIGRRKLEVKLSESNMLTAIQDQTHSGIAGGLISGLSINTWDKFINHKTRTKGYLLSGNILLGLASLKKLAYMVKVFNDKDDLQRNSLLCGQLIKYNDNMGAVHTGYLMPDSFDPNLARQHLFSYPIKWNN